MKLARDTWLTFSYEMGQLVHNPVNIAISLLQPITYLLLFTPFIKSVLGASTYSAAYQIYIPSLFCAMGVFSGMFAGFALIGAIRQGVIARFRITPLSRTGLLLGRDVYRRRCVFARDRLQILDPLDQIGEAVGLHDDRDDVRRGRLVRGDHLGHEHVPVAPELDLQRVQPSPRRAQL